MNNEARQHRFAPAKGACDILLIRHGETQAAVRGENFPMVDGQGDPALRPEGEAQARAVGERLKTHPIDAIYVTTMQRTHQTARSGKQSAPLVMRGREMDQMSEIPMVAFEVCGTDDGVP